MPTVVGIQFSGTVGGGGTKRWFTYNWRPERHVIWTVVPTSPNAGAPQLEWDVAVQRASPTALTYWITIRNLSAAEITVEARYTIVD
jgi:hypothetical protein